MAGNRTNFWMKFLDGNRTLKKQLRSGSEPILRKDTCTNWKNSETVKQRNSSDGDE